MVVQAPTTEDMQNRPDASYREGAKMKEKHVMGKGRRN
jgi:hypothetical protein